MFKINEDFGSITNKAGETLQIVVTPTKGLLVDALIGSAIISVTLSVIAIRAFDRGANAFMDAEYDVMSKLGIFKN